MAEMPGPPEAVHCGEMMGDPTVQKRYGVGVVIEAVGVAGLSAGACHEAPSLGEGRHRRRLGAAPRGHYFVKRRAFGRGTRFSVIHHDHQWQ